MFQLSCFKLCGGKNSQQPVEQGSPSHQPQPRSSSGVALEPSTPATRPRAALCSSSSSSSRRTAEGRSPPNSIQPYEKDMSLQAHADASKEFSGSGSNSLNGTTRGGYRSSIQERKTASKSMRRAGGRDSTPGSQDGHATSNGMQNASPAQAPALDRSISTSGASPALATASGLLTLASGPSLGAASSVSFLASAGAIFPTTLGSITRVSDAGSTETGPSLVFASTGDCSSNYRVSRDHQLSSNALISETIPTTAMGSTRSQGTGKLFSIDSLLSSVQVGDSRKNSRVSTSTMDNGLSSTLDSFNRGFQLPRVPSIMMSGGGERAATPRGAYTRSSMQGVDLYTIGPVLEHEGNLSIEASSTATSAVLAQHDIPINGSALGTYPSGGDLRDKQPPCADPDVADGCMQFRGPIDLEVHESHQSAGAADITFTCRMSGAYASRASGLSPLEGARWSDDGRDLSMRDGMTSLTSAVGGVTGADVVQHHKWSADVQAAGIKSLFPDLEVGDCIGKGAHGSVYLARWRGKVVAVKVIQYEVPLNSGRDSRQMASSSNMKKGRSSPSCMDFKETSLKRGGGNSPLRMDPNEQRRLLEGMIGVSAQHKNIVKTFRIATAPAMPLPGHNTSPLILSRSHTGALLWDTHEASSRSSPSTLHFEGSEGSVMSGSHPSMKQEHGLRSGTSRLSTAAAAAALSLVPVKEDGIGSVKEDGLSPDKSNDDDDDDGDDDDDDVESNAGDKRGADDERKVDDERKADDEKKSYDEKKACDEKKAGDKSGAGDGSKVGDKSDAGEEKAGDENDADDGSNADMGMKADRREPSFTALMVSGVEENRPERKREDGNLNSQVIRKAIEGLRHANASLTAAASPHSGNMQPAPVACPTLFPPFHAELASTSGLRGPYSVPSSEHQSQGKERTASRSQPLITLTSSQGGLSENVCRRSHESTSNLLGSLPFLLHVAGDSVNSLNDMGLVSGEDLKTVMSGMPYQHRGRLSARLSNTQLDTRSTATFSQTSSISRATSMNSTLLKALFSNAAIPLPVPGALTASLKPPGASSTVQMKQLTSSSTSHTDVDSSLSNKLFRMESRSTTFSGAGILGTLDSCAPGMQMWRTYIVQELCTMGTLRRALTEGVFHELNKQGQRQKINMLGLLEVARDVASAMSYLHSKGLLHGDLKADNVLLTKCSTDPRGYIAKLSDFGTSRLLSGSGEEQLIVSSIGTARHMAPETLRDNLVVLASDVYSFGVLMWELYCIDKPFSRYTNFQLLHAVCSSGEHLVFPSHCPESYADLANQCMAPDFHKRPPMSSVLVALNVLLSQAGAEALCGPNMADHGN